MQIRWRKKDTQSVRTDVILPGRTTRSSIRRLISAPDGSGNRNEADDFYARGDSIRSLGFVGGDFLYGLAHQDSRWMVNGRLEEVPMYALEIQGEDGRVLTRYEKSRILHFGVTVERKPIHLGAFASLSDTSYTKVNSDTIVCNADLERYGNGRDWLVHLLTKGKIYFVQLSSDVKNKERVNRIPAQRGVV